MSPENYSDAKYLEDRLFMLFCYVLHATAISYTSWLAFQDILFDISGTEGTWKGPFCFIQGADTQYGFIDLIAGKQGKEIT